MDTNDTTIGYNVRKSFLENIINICILFFRGKIHSKQKNCEQNGHYQNQVTKVLYFYVTLYNNCDDSDNYKKQSLNREDFVWLLGSDVPGLPIDWE